MLPLEVQTAEVLIAFFVSQALSFGCVILLSASLAFRVPKLLQRTKPGLYPAIIFLGSVFIILSMYFEDYTLALVIAGGLFLGGGCAGLFTLWQSIFAAMSTERSNLTLILGAMAAPFVYSVVNLAPEAIAAFLVPMLLAPLCDTCLTIATHEVDFNQPMFEDKPSEHSGVYHRAVKDHWRSALCLGALGFVSGIVRGIAVLNDDIVFLVNEASLVGMLISAVILLIACCFRWLKIDLTDMFRIVYPALIVGFLLVPFLGAHYLTAFVTLTYFTFSLIHMLMMMQVAQISRNRGIHPIFIFGLFAGIAYIMQSIGFIVGWFGTLLPDQPALSLFGISQISTFILSMSLFIAIGSSFKDLLSRNSISLDSIELFHFTNNSFLLKAIEDKTRSAVKLAERTKPKLPATSLSAEQSNKPCQIRRKKVSPLDDADVMRDMISKQCHILKARYGLSIRELEIAELLVRGNTVPAIATKLFISEHTVKTHSKHIYAKLGIHKKQELLELVEDIQVH